MASSEHPINSSTWHEAYPAPDERTMALLCKVDVKMAGRMLQEDADVNADVDMDVDPYERAEYDSDYDSDEETGGKQRSLLIIDVRRADCESMIPGAINIPAHTLHSTLPTLLPLLAREKLVIFHCGSSRGRGPRAAAWYAEALEEYLWARARVMGKWNPRKESQLEAKAMDIGASVGVLVGGIKAWEEEFGTRPIEERGKKHEARDADGNLDLRTIPL